MPSTIPTHSRALDALEASINSILLQTGSTFCDPANYDSWKIARTSTQIKHALSPALTSFHDALDELERELIRARAVLQRDFNIAQQQKMSTTLPNNLIQAISVRNDLDDDAMMQDATQDPIASDRVDSHRTLISPPLKTEEDPDLSEAHPVEDGEILQKQDVETQTMAETQLHEIPSNAVIPGFCQAPESQPDRSNTDNGDVMINSEKATKSATTPLNIETEQPAPSNDYGSHDDVFGSTPGTTNMTPIDPSLSAVDVNSLLPGLEFYANDNNVGGDDSFDGFINLSNPASNDFTLNNGSAQASTSIPAEDLLAAGETSNMNFDDFFASFGGEVSSTIGGGQTQPNGEIEDTSFDESFFNLD